MPARFYTVPVSFDTLQRLFQRILNGLSEPWEFLVEVLLIGLSINWCAGVLQGTRGTRLLRGLLILLIGVTLIVRVLAEQLGWIRLELLYRYFVTALAFIALIAFQPELRRALIRAGDMRFFRRGNAGSKAVSSLVEAVGRFARTRHGALIAIQREVGLANWAEHGVQINADVSADLLDSIFFPNSPLHDLGVVVRGNRVLAASCQFPLAESGDVDVTLGSRHRAAVGLSQESDALIVVVSEETGAISLADQGELIRHLSLDDLERELPRRLNPAADGPKWNAFWSFTDLKRILRRAAVVVPLTLVVWFLADQASLTRAEGIGVLLTLQQPDNVRVDVETPQPPLFRIAVRGSMRDLDALRRETTDRPLRAEWNIQSRYTSPGTYRVATAELIDLLESLPAIRARGLAVEGVSPDSMSLAVDEVVTVKLPVRAESGAVRLSDVRFEPPDALVTLKKNDYDRLPPAGRAITAKILERIARVPVDQAVTLDDIALDGRIGASEALAIEPPVVRASLRVLAETLKITLPRVPVQIAASPLFWERFEVQRIEPREEAEWVLELEFEGDRSLAEALKTSDVLAFISLTSDIPINEVRSAEVEIRAPAGLKLLSPVRTVQFKVLARETSAP
jgi:diadenylate cyclase